MTLEQRYKVDRAISDGFMIRLLSVDFAKFRFIRFVWFKKGGDGSRWVLRKVWNEVLDGRWQLRDLDQCRGTVDSRHYGESMCAVKAAKRTEDRL